MIIKIDKVKQEIFSKLSNDYNPIHLNNKYTYKTSFDKPIIYGILLVLESLNNLILNTKKKFEFINVEFIIFININDNIILKYDNNIIKIYKEDNILCTIIKYNLSDDNSNFILNNYDNNLINPSCNEIPENIHLYKLNINLEILEKYYINIFKNFNLLQIFQLINLSTFVGMITPGLNSIFNSFEFTDIDNNYDDLYTLNFNLINFDKTFKSCLYSFEGMKLKGNLTCIYRPQNIEQIKLKNINIDNKQFINEKVLVIGGSRGLGEVISKIFFSGGADVTITYFNCYDEAIKIHQESNEKIKIFKYDVLEDFEKINLLSDNIQFSKIFYMASPKVNKFNIFNIDLFENYYNYYCKGFLLLFKNINKSNLKYIFYPSSKYLDIKNDYLEYTLSKNIGESIINNLIKDNKNILFDCVRLPRLLTDLTNNIIDITSDPYKYFLEYYKIKNKNTNITILSNLNTDFILTYLKNNINKYLNNEYNFITLPFGQLYQNIINPQNEIIESKYLFFLLSLEDILNEDIIFYYKEEYIKILDNFFINLINFCNKILNSNIYFFKLKQKYISPFDDSNYSVTKLLNYFNEKISKIPNIKIIENYYNKNIFDIDFYLESRSSYSLDFYEYLSNKITGIILNNIGKTIKCIVVDLDNTLWEGVLVDDGVDNIKISNDYPDNKWRLFQKILKIYQERGILLAICSKNNENLVLEALEKNENLLKKNDFVVIKSNWNPKSQNIFEISRILNINEEHILFIDDNIIEREEVKQNLPKCRILEINKINPIHYIEQILNCPLLYNINILETDLNKNEQYNIKNKIEIDKKQFNNLHDFYYSLNTKITFKYINNNNFKRALQLTAKTNQFNLNKYVFNEDEFNTYLNKNNGIILEYTDKFTNFDQVGVILLKYTDTDIIIDNIILSCRVFNRDFEKCIFILIKKIAYNLQKNIIGILNKTDKNTIFYDIYINNGFYYDNNLNNFICNNIINEEYPLWITCDDISIHNNKNKTNNFILNKKIIEEIIEIKTNENLNEKDINIIKIFVIDSLLLNDYNINTFYECEGFSSIKMVLLINKIKNKYNYDFNIKIFFNDENELIDINLFCERIYNIINKKNEIILDKNISDINNYKISIIKNEDELKKLNDFLLINYKNKFAYLDTNILKWNLKGYRDVDDSIINVLFSKEFSNNNYSFKGILFTINIYIQYILDKKIYYQNSDEILIWKYLNDNNSLESLNPINYLLDKNNCMIASTLIEDTSLIVLRNLNFYTIDCIPCYVLPLQKSYKNLILDSNITENEIDEWIIKIKNKYNLYNDTLESHDFNYINCNLLEEIWILFSLKYNLLSYYKNSEYFKWRFIDSKYYKYLINGNIDDGYIIWREEETCTHNIGVRIMEILPGKKSLLNNKIFTEFIQKFINYCINKKYEVIDFLCTSNILDEFLFDNNFKLKNINNNGITSVPIYFKMKKHFFNRNMVIYIKNKELLNNNNIYFTKSMAELDKPNCRFCKKPFCEKLYSEESCI